MIIAGTVLLSAVLCVYFVPRAKYTGKAITKDILNSIPEKGRFWETRGVNDLKEGLDGAVYNFVSKIFARQYVNSKNPKQALFLVVVDAGNFHYPKVCFEGTGYDSEELAARDLAIGPGKLQAHLLLNKKGEEATLSVYWICIDKKIVPTWARQKVKQLFYSLFNKERVGLMIRVDIPVSEDINKSIEITQDFLKDLYRSTPETYRGYIFSELDGGYARELPHL